MSLTSMPLKRVQSHQIWTVEGVQEMWMDYLCPYLVELAINGLSMADMPPEEFHTNGRELIISIQLPLLGTPVVRVPQYAWGYLWDLN